MYDLHNLGWHSFQQLCLTVCWEVLGQTVAKLSHLRERGIGVFPITHHLGFARRAADQVLFMDGGRVEEKGSADILLDPKSERLKQFLNMAEMAA